MQGDGSTDSGIVFLVLHVCVCVNVCTTNFGHSFVSIFANIIGKVENELIYCCTLTRFV